jgi:sporulation protein YlmC with PRC-barrel domain
MTVRAGIVFESTTPARASEKRRPPPGWWSAPALRQDQGDAAEQEGVLEHKGGPSVKKTATVLAASILSLAVALSASAQTRPSTEAGSKSDTGKAQRQAWAPQAGAMEASKLIGTKVKNDQGKDIAEIDQLIVDPSDGKVTHVVLGRGGMMGVGEQKVVLGWSDVKLQPDPNNQSRMIGMVEQSKIDGAPRYEARRDRDMAPAASPSTTRPAPKTN